MCAVVFTGALWMIAPFVMVPQLHTELLIF